MSEERATYQAGDENKPQISHQLTLDLLDVISEQQELLAVLLTMIPKANAVPEITGSIERTKAAVARIKDDITRHQEVEEWAAQRKRVKARGES